MDKKPEEENNAVLTSAEGGDVDNVNEGVDNLNDDEDSQSSDEGENGETSVDEDGDEKNGNDKPQENHGVINTQSSEMPAPKPKSQSTKASTSSPSLKVKPNQASSPQTNGNVVTKRVRLQGDSQPEGKQKEDPKVTAKVLARKRTPPPTAAVPWRDYLLIIVLCISLLLGYKLLTTPPPTIIVAPPIVDGGRDRASDQRLGEYPKGYSSDNSDRRRDLFKGQPDYTGWREHGTLETHGHRFSENGYYIEDDREEREGNGKEQRTKAASTEELSATKSYFLNNRDLLKRVSHVEFIRNATAFIRGYARMKAVCDELINALGLRSLVQHHSGQGEKLTSRFDDHLYLPSGSAYGPNFCLNIPGDILFQYDFDPNIKLAPAESDAHRRFGTTWREMTSDGTIVTNSISPGQLFASSSLHSPTLMGYFLQHFYVRDLQALGNKTNTSLVTGLVPYNVFIDGIDAIAQPNNDKPVCVCGPHMNMPRHIVVYADRNAPKGRLYLEPTIISKHDSAIVSTATMPWTRSPFDRNDATAYQRAEESLRNELKLSSITSSNNVVVDSMQLIPGTSGLKRVFRYEGGRQVSPLSGSEANCLCYCEALFYEIRRAADEMMHLSPQDVILGAAPTIGKPT